MLPLRVLSLLVFFLLPSVASAVDLTPADCALLKDAYEVVPAECTRPKVQAEVAQLTPEQRSDHVFFTRGGAKLDAAAKSQLDVLLQVLETAPMRNACLRLVGHADASGSPVVNIRLSRARAEVVAEYLRKHLATPARIAEVAAAGSANTLANFPEAAPENRRVAFHARDCKAD